MSIFHSRLKYVTCKTWDTVSNPGFPELGDQGLSVDHIKDRPEIGVAFSGGGSRELWIVVCRGRKTAAQCSKFL